MFTRDVCVEMAAANPGGAPIILTLSQGDMQEAKAAQVRSIVQSVGGLYSLSGAL
jgi:hypothetical protein